MVEYDRIYPLVHNTVNIKQYHITLYHVISFDVTVYVVSYNEVAIKYALVLRNTI